MNPVKYLKQLLPHRSKTLRLGKSITFTRRVHASVGYWSKIQFDENLFSLSTRSTVPEHCDCGGDEGEVTCSLTAIAKGTSEISITDFFRGTVTNVETIRIKIR